MNELPEQLQIPMVGVLLSTADDKLFLGHRNSDWTGIAPILEADIAFSSLAQDDIAHASVIYELVGTLTNQNADQIAFGRNAIDYLCADIVTKSDQFNWASAIARQFYCNIFDYHRLKRLSESTWTPLASLAKRLCDEQAIHVDHVSSWINHLGRGNEDSKVRIQKAIDEYAPYASMLFEAPKGLEQLRDAGILINNEDFYTTWKKSIEEVIQEAGLSVHIEPHTTEGGRSGVHDEDFMHSLTELQEVFSTDPVAAW